MKKKKKKNIYHLCDLVKQNQKNKSGLSLKKISNVGYIQMPTFSIEVLKRSLALKHKGGIGAFPNVCGQ